MQLCQICFHHFKPPQTFQSLFTHQTVCDVCALLKETPLNKAVLPIDYSECHIYTSKRPRHPAIFHNVMEKLIYESQVPVIFMEHINDRTLNPWPLLAKLLTPLVIYTPKALTLDEMEKIIT